ncbi:MAG: hypothetical protein QFB86_04220 [Patescibacteria group bacterium]|nr:hypothetical protein [Patescibacteria group bacterium]
MKQKDIALIAVIIFISAIFSVFVSKALFGGSTTKNQEAEVVQAISPSFAELNKSYFNNESIDPTKKITIGEHNNPSPFQSKAQ